MCRQVLGQTFDYYTKMRKLTSGCDLIQFGKSLLRDMLIIGLSDKSLQERLLGEANLYLT